MCSDNPAIRQLRVWMCRFKKEQALQMAMPAPTTYTESTSVQEYSALGKAAASLGQLSFGVSHARGVQ